MASIFARWSCLIPVTRSTAGIVSLDADTPAGKGWTRSGAQRNRTYTLRDAGSSAGPPPVRAERIASTPMLRPAASEPRMVHGEAMGGDRGALSDSTISPQCPPGGIGRKGRKLSSAFVQVEATYRLEV